MQVPWRSLMQVLFVVIPKTWETPSHTQETSESRGQEYDAVKRDEKETLLLPHVV